MNKLVERGFSVYKIFLKNKLASSIIMLISGVMMFVAALNGHGNDTKSLPLLITSVGTILTLWAVYRLGYVKSCYDKIEIFNREEKLIERKILFLQIGETLVYTAISRAGNFFTLKRRVYK